MERYRSDDPLRGVDDDLLRRAEAAARARGERLEDVIAGILSDYAGNDEEPPAAS